MHPSQNLKGTFTLGIYQRGHFLVKRTLRRFKVLPRVPKSVLCSAKCPQVEIGDTMCPQNSVHGLGTHYLAIKKKGERRVQPCLPRRPYLFFGLNFSQRKMPKVLAWITLLLSVPLPNNTQNLFCKMLKIKGSKK